MIPNVQNMTEKEKEFVGTLPEIFQRLLNGDIVGAYEIAEDVPTMEGRYILDSFPGPVHSGESVIESVTNWNAWNRSGQNVIFLQEACRLSMHMLLPFYYGYHGTILLSSYRLYV